MAKINRKAVNEVAGKLRRKAISDFQARVGNFRTSLSQQALSFVPEPVRYLINTIREVLSDQSSSYLDHESVQAQPDDAQAPIPEEISSNALLSSSSILGKKYHIQVPFDKQVPVRGNGSLYQGILQPNHQPITIKAYKISPKNKYDHWKPDKEIVDGGLRDFRIILPDDYGVARQDDGSTEKYFDLIFKNSLYDKNSLYGSAQTLREYIETDFKSNNPGDIDKIDLVYGVMDQVLQSLQFLHTQTFRFPFGLANSGIAHGNLSLDSLLIVHNSPGFSIYLCDLAVWEKQFKPLKPLPEAESEAESKNAVQLLQEYQCQAENKNIQEKDLQKLGEAGLELFRKLDLDNSKLLKKFIRELKKFIQDLEKWQKPEKAKSAEYKPAAEARQKLHEIYRRLYPQNSPREVPKSQGIQSEQKSETKQKSMFLLYGVLGVLSLIFLLGFFWLFLRDRQSKVVAYQPLKSIDKLSPIPQGKFTYISESRPDGVWSSLVTNKMLLPGGVSLEQKIDNLAKGLDLQLQEQVVSSDLLSLLNQKPQVDFAIISEAKRNLDVAYKEFAYDGLVVFVAFSKQGRSNSLPPALNGKITLEQLRKIYTGQVHNWKELGGPDLDITLYIPTNPELVEIFKQKVLQNQSPELIISRKDKRGILQAVIQDFENPDKPVGSIGFGSLSQVFNQCSVYPLAIVDQNHIPVAPLIKKNGQVVTPQVDLCNDKGSYVPNIEALTSQRYPLTYPLAVAYLRDNRREPVGEEFSQILKTTESQCFLKQAGLAPLQPLAENACDHPAKSQ